MIYQITFFITLIVLDEKRIRDNRRDCCFCCRGPEDMSTELRHELSGHPDEHFADRVMARYGNWLLRPHIKWMVIVFFSGMLAFFSWRTSELDQVSSILPLLVHPTLFRR